MSSTSTTNQKDPAKKTYILDVDNRHSPCYVAGINERNPRSTMEYPWIMAIPGHPYFLNKQLEFHPTSFELQDDILVVADELEMDLKLAAMSRHFIIPFPGYFLDSNAVTRGNIQAGNPYASYILKFVETLEFLLSDEGIHLTWAGTLEGETLPPNLWRKRFDARGAEMEIRNEDKKALDHLTEFYSAGDAEEGMEWFEQLTSGDRPRLVKDPKSLQMTIKKEDVDEQDFKTDRATVYWEFVPLVEPDFGFSQEEKEQFPEEMMFDKDGGIECILIHFIIKDPRIDIQKGLHRLYSKEIEVSKLKKGEGKPDDSSGTQEDFNVLKYAIHPRTLVEIFSILSTDAELLKCREYENPGCEIFSKHNQYFNPCHLFSVKYLRELPPIWNTSFDYLKYTTSLDNTFNTTEDIFKTRPQCIINTKKVVLRKDMEGGVDDFDQDVYTFPIPARVVRIPASRVHPAVLSNCLIPYFNTSPINLRNVPFKEYSDDVPPKLRKLMIPELTDIGLTELAQELDYLKRHFKRRRLHTTPENEFLVDALRVDKFNTSVIVDDIRFILEDGKATPCQTIQVVRRLLCQDFESEAPKAPAPQRAIYTWIKTQRKKDDQFSLFPDVYGEEGFTFYENLSVSANFDANIFEILDDLYAIHQNHKHIMHVYSLLLLATQLNYGDLFFTIFYGPSQVSKSYICKLVSTDFAIPGTTLEEGSQTNQAMNSGTSYRTGMMVIEDDMGPETSKIFTTTGKEIDSSANVKQMLTQKQVKRTVLMIDPKTGARTSVELESDHRITEVGCSNNDGSSISPATKSRLLLIMVEKLRRGLNATSLDLKREACFPGASLDRAKLRMSRLMHSRQAFTCLIFQAIRCGALPYNSEQNLLYAKSLHERFKNSLASVLDDDNLPQSLRMENGQLFPLMQEKMISRIYKAICSGVFIGHSQVLIPKAKFNLPVMLDEIWKRGLLQFTESDYIEAISFFDQNYSQETSGIILKTIGKIAKQQTSESNRPESVQGISFGETPIDGVQGNNTGLSKKDSKVIPRGPWVSYPRVFFNERKGPNNYITNYNWIDMGSLFPLASLPTKDNDRSPILNILASSIQQQCGSESSAILIFQFLTQFKEMFTKQRMIYQELHPQTKEWRLVQSHEYHEIPILKVVDQAPYESKGQGTIQFVLLSSQWLHEKLGKVLSADIVTASPACAKYKATATELALQFLSYNCCYPGEYLLPGMTFDKPLFKDDYATPQIPKTLKLIDIRDHPKGKYLKELLARKLKPHLFFQQRAGTGERLGYNGGQKWGIPAEVDYFTTYTHIKLMDRMLKKCGVEKDGEFKRDTESIDEVLKKYIEEGGLLINSPSGIENAFSNIRNEALREAGYDSFKNYIATMMEKEEMAVNNAKGNFLTPVMANDEMMGFSLKRGRDEDDVMMVDDEDGDDFLRKTMPPPKKNNDHSRTFKSNNNDTIVTENKKTSHEIVEEAWRIADAEEDQWPIPTAPEYEYEEEEETPEEEIYDDDRPTASDRKREKLLVEAEADVDEDEPEGY